MYLKKVESFKASLDYIRILSRDNLTFRMDDIIIPNYFIKKKSRIVL